MKTKRKRQKEKDKKKRGVVRFIGCGSGFFIVIFINGFCSCFFFF
jgi:hypothetical protein